MQTSYKRAMRQALLWRTVAAAALLALSACGGGGENAGECFGSDEVCQGLTSAEPALSFVQVPAEQLGTVSCLDIRAANGADPVKEKLAAQDAYRRGATQLDGDPKDGIPCNGVF